MTSTRTMVSTVLLLPLVISMTITPTRAFSIQPTPIYSRSPSGMLVPTTHSKLSMSSKDDEIAKLEEKLQRLKEEKEAESSAADQPEEEEPLEEVPIDLFMSESWKEQEAASEVESGEGGGVGGIVGALFGLVLLVALSQVPVGQEGLSTYSAELSNPDRQINLGDKNREAVQRTSYSPDL